MVRVLILTKVIGNSVGAVCKHPEKNSFRSTHESASFVHTSCNVRTASIALLHVDVTRHCYVLPSAKHKQTSQGTLLLRVGGLHLYKYIQNKYKISPFMVA